MKTKTVFFLLYLVVSNLLAQTSCEDFMKSIEDNNYGSTYTSYDSTAISSVTFYGVTLNYSYRYFAVVCFKPKYGYSCNKYIYEVSSQTKVNYSLAYLNSAGKAFWKYIEPYNKVLGCAPKLG